MAFSLSTRGFPPRARFTSYESVLALYNDIKPTRSGLRKLKYRSSNNSCTIRKGEDGTVYCRYHSTDVVTFSPDGTIHVGIGYNSVSTRAFANACTPYYVSVETNSGYQEVYIPSKGYYYPLTGKFTILPDGGVDCVQVERRMVNMKCNREVRKLYGRIAALMDTIAIMQGGAVWASMHGDIPKMLIDTMDVEGMVPYISWGYKSDSNALLDRLRSAMDGYVWVPVPFGTQISTNSMLRILTND